MTRNAKFPLFSLPLLAIGEVMSSMDPFETINFSLASSIGRRLAKVFSGSRRKFQLYLVVNESLKVSIVDPSFRFWIIQIHNNRNQSCNREINNKSRENTMPMFSENKIDAWKNIARMAKEVFNIQKASIVFYLDSFQTNRAITDFLNNLFTNYNSVAISGDNVAHEDVSYVLEKLKTEGNLNLDMEMRVYEKEVPLKIRNRLADLDIFFGEWIGLEELLQFNALTISIVDNKLTTEALATLLKRWMAFECYENVKRFEIVINGQEDFNKIVGMVPHIIPDPERRIFRGELHFPVHPGVDIRRKDGVLATICTFQHFTGFLMVMKVHS